MSDITSVIPLKNNNKTLHLRRTRLEVIEGPDAGKSATFEADVIRIGSLNTSDFQLSDDTVSRQHAEIIRDQHGVLLRDHSSTNGTFVGAVRIREVYLGANRSFCVGKTKISFQPINEVVTIVASERTQYEGLVGESVAIREVFSIIKRVAPTELTVLITGETGTGKELASRAIHSASTRRSGPFVVFDCGSVAKNLIESELFGHERGAFTGAVGAREGVFEQANSGTLFLDELGELPLNLQPTLLRVLEQREVRRVGGQKTRAINVRIVAATNRSLRDQVEEGLFRSDLYYRLAVVELHLPPLRDRLEDINLLAQHLLRTAPMKHPLKGLSPEVLSAFSEWTWPGNIRELRNALLRAIPFCDGEWIELSNIASPLRSKTKSPPLKSEPPTDILPNLSLKDAKNQIIQAFERNYLEQLLSACDGNLSEAARRAGVDRKTIARMLKRHDLR